MEKTNLIFQIITLANYIKHYLNLDCFNDWLQKPDMLKTLVIGTTLGELSRVEGHAPLQISMAESVLRACLFYNQGEIGQACNEVDKCHKDLAQLMTSNLFKGRLYPEKP